MISQVILVLSCTSVDSTNNQVEPLSHFSKNFDKIEIRERIESNLLHLLWDSKYDTSTVQNLICDHPLNVSNQAFLYLYIGNKENNKRLIEKGFQYLHALEKYNNIFKTDSFDTYRYNFKFSRMKAGWWSAMANSSIAVTYQLAFEISNNPKYKQLANRAILSVIKPTDIGGCSIIVRPELKENVPPLSGPWFLEYADSSSTFNNSKLVLNGYLFTLINLKLYYESTGDEIIKDQYSSSMKVYEYLSKKFLYKDSSWTNYMLNPLTPEPTHYAIYDLLLLEILVAMEAELGFIREELKNRRSILRRSFPVYHNEDSLQFYFSGKPHPHWIDTYSIKLKLFLDGKTKTYKHNYQRDLSKDFLDRTVMTIPFQSFDSIQVSTYSTDETFLFTQKKYVIPDLSPAVVLNPDLSEPSNSLFAGQLNWYQLNRGTENAVIEFRDSSLIFEELEYFGAFVKYNSKIRSIRIFIESESGAKISRYYLKPVEGLTTFIHLHKSGFYHPDLIGPKDKIAKIQFRIYGDNENPVKIDYSDLHFFRNQVVMHKFLCKYKSEFRMHEVATNGNVY